MTVTHPTFSFHLHKMPHSHILVPKCKGISCRGNSLWPKQRAQTVACFSDNCAIIEDTPCTRAVHDYQHVTRWPTRSNRPKGANSKIAISQRFLFATWFQKRPPALFHYAPLFHSICAQQVRKPHFTYPWSANAVWTLASYSSKSECGWCWARHFTKLLCVYTLGCWSTSPIVLQTPSLSRLHKFSYNTWGWGFCRCNSIWQIAAIDIAYFRASILIFPCFVGLSLWSLPLLFSIALSHAWHRAHRLATFVVAFISSHWSCSR